MANKIRCSECGSRDFKKLDMRNGKYELECFCGNVIKGLGGVEVDSVQTANMNF